MRSGGTQTQRETKEGWAPETQTPKTAFSSSPITSWAPQAKKRGTAESATQPTPAGVRRTTKNAGVRRTTKMAVKGEVRKDANTKG